MITGAEVVTVAKTGANVTRGIKASLSTQPARWPNAHEALMELYVILDEWCQSAEETNRDVHQAIRRNFPIDEAWEIKFLQAQIDRDLCNSGDLISPKFIDRRLNDAAAVLTPPIPWVIRWRGSKRRAAARLTLRNMMKIYCPDLIASFDKAADARAAWVRTVKADLGNLLAGTTAPPQINPVGLVRIEAQTASTLHDLQTVRDELRTLIIERYPLGTPDD